MTGMGRFLSAFFLLICFVLAHPLPAASPANPSGRLTGSSGWVREFGIVTPDMIEQLRAELWLHVSASPQEGGQTRLLSPREVISSRRNYPGLSTLAGNKMAGIQRLTMGTAPEFVAVGWNYVLFYEGVARGSWGPVLRWRLRKADDSLKKLARQTLARKVYLDVFERELDGNQEPLAGPFGAQAIPGLEKSRMELYLDGAEKRFNSP